RSGGSRQILTRGCPTEHGFPAGPDVDNLPTLQFELLRLLLRQLRQQVLAVVPDELDAHLEAEVDDALDHRLRAARVRLEQQLDVVRPNEGVAEPVQGAAGG